MLIYSDIMNIPTYKYITQSIAMIAFLHKIEHQYSSLYLSDTHHISLELISSESTTL